MGPFEREIARCRAFHAKALAEHGVQKGHAIAALRLAPWAIQHAGATVTDSSGVSFAQRCALAGFAKGGPVEATAYLNGLLRGFEGGMRRERAWVAFFSAAAAGDGDQAAAIHETLTGLELEGLDSVMFGEAEGYVNIRHDGSGKCRDDGTPVDEMSKRRSGETLVVCKLADVVKTNSEKRAAVMGRLAIASCARRGCLEVGTMRCTGCGTERYCGRQCQRAAWKAHKRECCQ